MIQVTLDESVLKQSTRNTLSRNQASVDSKVEWEEKVRSAEKKWNQKPKGAFDEIKAVLAIPCGRLNLCCYCECDRSAQVEHIFNKKLYPERTFRFENYLLVCPSCNNHKLDAFAVFDSQDGISFNEYEKGGPRIRPINADSVFINPREENPMDFLFLDLTTGEYVIHPKASARDEIRAEYTRYILQLNEDKALTERRKVARVDYERDLQAYLGCRNSSDLEELSMHLPSGKVPSADSLSFEEMRIAGMRGCLELMAQRMFPTIWLEMKRQYQLNPANFDRLYPALKATLDSVPELLD